MSDAPEDNIINLMQHFERERAKCASYAPKLQALYGMFSCHRLASDYMYVMVNACDHPQFMIGDDVYQTSDIQNHLFMENKRQGWRDPYYFVLSFNLKANFDAQLEWAGIDPYKFDSWAGLRANPINCALERFAEELSEYPKPQTIADNPGLVRTPRRGQLSLVRN